MAQCSGDGIIPLRRPENICSPVPFAIQLRIATAFWAAIAPSNYAPTALEAYFKYYNEQCQTFYHSLGTNLPLSNHDDIIQLAREMRAGLTRQHILESVENRYPAIVSNEHFEKPEIINGAVDLVARLLLMVDVGKPATNNRMWTGRAFRSWDQGSIHDFTTAIFPAQRSGGHSGIELSTDLNARNLDVIGGFKVELTDNLLDHLEVVDIEGETTIMIFHHASFLMSQKHALFPQGFVEETIQTLALLFPQNKWYKDCRAWYHRHLKAIMREDAGVLSCGPLTMTNIDAYQFWRDRLVRLKLVYDQAKPRTLRQWWNDRREGTQWYALWVAVGFTIFFGLVQSVEGALQVYKSYHPGD
jgi:hypothetical protein